MQPLQGKFLQNNIYNYIHNEKWVHKENANFARKNSHANCNYKFCKSKKINVCSSNIRSRYSSKLSAYFLTKSYLQAMFFWLLIFSTNIKNSLLIASRFNTFLFQFIFNGKTNVHFSLFNFHTHYDEVVIKRDFLKIVMNPIWNLNCYLWGGTVFNSELLWFESSAFSA